MNRCSEDMEGVTQPSNCYSLDNEWIGTVKINGQKEKIHF